MALEIADDRLHFVPSKYANTMIAIKPTDDDAYYIFRKTKTITSLDGTKSESYRCRGCEQVKGDGFFSTTLLRNGRIVREPDAEHRIGCVPLTRVQLEALKLRREMIRRCREGSDPSVAYEMVLAESATVFDADDESGQVLRDEVGSFESLRQILRRNASKKRSDEYSQLTTREKRRLSAVLAARKKRAAKEHQVPSYAIEESIVQEDLDETSAAIEWLHTDMPVIGSQVRRPNPISSSLNSQPPRLVPYPKTIVERSTIPEHDYNTIYRTSGAGASPADVPSASMITAKSTPNRRAVITSTPSVVPGTARSLATIPTRQQKAASKSTEEAVSGNQKSSTDVALPNASFVDIVKVVEACRNKTRWESFGEYVAKTLESMNADTATRAAREIQEIMFRVQSE